MGGVSRIGLRPDGARVVHQNVEPAELGHGALDHIADGVFIAHIGRNRKRAAAERADRIGGFVDAAGQLLGGLLALRCHHHVRALLGQTQRQCLADTAARSGDDGDAAVQIGMQNCCSESGMNSIKAIRELAGHRRRHATHEFLAARRGMIDKRC